MLLIFLFSTLMSASLSLVLTPYVIHLAVVIGAVDKPDKRKIHNHPMPRLGGLATFISFSLTLFVMQVFFRDAKLGDIVPGSGWWMLALAMVGIFGVGVFDDVRELKPGQKFLVQVIAATLVYFAGFRIEIITNPFSGSVMSLGDLSFPITILWIVGITNAFNLIDGLDGLAGGVAAICCLTITAISLLHGDALTAVLALTLAGSVLGFLRYNFNPARIFLGDSGSLFIGFTVSILSMQSATKGSMIFSVMVPMFALGVPIMDTSLAMIRRVLGSFNSDQGVSTSLAGKLHSMFTPDRRHLHHQLLAHGFSHRGAVLVLYAASIGCGVCAFLVTVRSLNSWWILAIVTFVGMIAVRKLDYREMAVIKNGLLLRVYSKAILKRSLPLIMFDTISVFAAFFISHALTGSAQSSFVITRMWFFVAAIICAIQVSILMWGGLYRRTVKFLGVGDLLQIMKSTAISVIAAACAFKIFPLTRLQPDTATFVVLDFYFLATFVVGVRAAFHMLNYTLHRNSTEGKKAIIYGADSLGLLTLQTLASSESLRQGERVVTPVGFIDDNPEMEGKFLDGYPVYGGHWKLEGLIKKMDVGEVVIASPDVTPLAFSRIRKIAETNGVTVRVYQITLAPVGAEDDREVSVESHQEKERMWSPRVA